ncbi:MAG: putative subtilase-type serine protease precursor [Gemmataceae bacterium]|nr:putative subtilase-type serine protease precursor [Gemmataceae bacterium]
MHRATIFLILPFALATSAPSSAQKKDPEKKDQPRVLYSVPLVVAPGEKGKLVLRGKNLDAVKEVTVAGADGAKVKVLGGKKTAVGNNQPAERIGDTEVEIELDLPKGAKPGRVKLTAVGPGGGSAAYTLLLPDDTPAVKEKEPNDGFDQAQAIPVPAAVEGTIKGERDTDVYKFDGKKGDKLRIEVQAARFGSPVDALITVYDGGRRVVAAADDTDGSPDPALTVTLPRDGPFYVTVLDAHDLGGPQFGYRLVVKKDK